MGRICLRMEINMKKLIKQSVIIMIIISMSALTACGINGKNTDNDEQNNTQYNAESAQVGELKVAALKGPTGIGMVKLMQDSQDGKTANKYDFKIAAAADEFSASLIKGDIDAAALPCNAAAALYNKSGGKIKVIAINTLGVLYILDTGNEVKALSDLKGKTIYTTGKGTTPEYTLKYLLEQAGLDVEKDVKIEFKSEAAEVAAIMKKSEKDVVAMLPQPYVTTVMDSNPNVRIAIDVTKEWEKLTGGASTVVTGVIAVNTDYYNNNKAVIDKFMEEYRTSTQYVVENVEVSSNYVEKFGIFKTEVAKKAIPYCNITFISGDEMKEKIQSYLEVLYKENPASVGGKMPDENFYGM